MRHGLTYCEGTRPAGQDKWEELRVPEMLLSIDIWVNALKRVDKDPSRVKRLLVDPGYCVPELALLISGQTPEHRKLFMTNWLAIRPLWISRLGHDPPARFPSPQQWREILYGVSSKEELEATAACSKSKGHGSGKDCKLAILDIFGEAAAAMTSVVQGPASGPRLGRAGLS